MGAVLPVVILSIFANYLPLSSHWRTALIHTAVTFAVLLVAITELLSALTLMTNWTLFISWLMVVIVNGFLVIRRREQIKQAILPIKPQIGVLDAAIGLIMVAIGAIALISPPNNWDSMTYHLPRIVMWAQNHAVAHFPTPDTRQLFSAPFVEFVQLHLFALSQGDIFLNLVQWSAMVVSAVTASTIAGQFGLGKTGQRFAAVLVVTLPIGIMQASNTKNDYMTGMWTLCLLFYTLNLLHSDEDEGQLWWILGMGACAGLAVLTKATGYVYVFPVLLWIGLVWLFQRRWHIFRVAAVVGVLILMINAGHFWRNYTLFGSPLSDSFQSNSVTTEELSLRVMFSVGIRNLLMNTYVPPYATTLRSTLYTVLEDLHAPLGLAVNDPRSTFPESTFEFPNLWEIQYENFAPKPLILHEDFAPNPLHLGAFFVAILLWVVLRRADGQQRTAGLFLVGVAQFVVFSAIVAWQPWGTRLQLPWFLFAGLFTSVVLAQRLPKLLLNSIAWGFIAAAMFWIVFGIPRSLIDYARPDDTTFTILDKSRDQMVFLSRPELYTSHVQITDYFRQSPECASIGLMMYGEWQYPLYRHLEAAVPGLRLQNVVTREDLTDIYTTTPYNDFEPCAVVAALHGQIGQIMFDDQIMYRVWKNNFFSVFASEGFSVDAYNNSIYSVQIYPQRADETFHVYSNCQQGQCQLIAVIDPDALSPQAGFVTRFSQNGDWYAEVTYIQTYQDGTHAYQTSVYDGAGQLIDDGFTLYLGENITSWGATQ